MQLLIVPMGAGEGDKILKPTNLAYHLERMWSKHILLHTDQTGLDVSISLHTLYISREQVF